MFASAIKYCLHAEVDSLHSKIMGLLDTRFAYFFFDGSLDSVEVTWKDGFLPSKRKRSMWKLRSRLDLHAPLESHVNDILDQLDANKNEFLELSRELGGTMQIVSYFSENEPGIHFDQKTVSRIAEYSLCITCNFYSFR